MLEPHCKRTYRRKESARFARDNNSSQPNPTTGALYSAHGMCVFDYMFMFTCAMCTELLNEVAGAEAAIVSRAQAQRCTTDLPFKPKRAVIKMSNTLINPHGTGASISRTAQFGKARARGSKQDLGRGGGGGRCWWNERLTVHISGKTGRRKYSCWICA